MHHININCHYHGRNLQKKSFYKKILVFIKSTRILSELILNWIWGNINNLGNSSKKVLNLVLWPKFPDPSPPPNLGPYFDFFRNTNKDNYLLFCPPQPKIRGVNLWLLIVLTSAKCRLELGGCPSGAPPPMLGQSPKFSTFFDDFP